MTNVTTKNANNTSFIVGQNKNTEIKTQAGVTSHGNTFTEDIYYYWLYQRELHTAQWTHLLNLNANYAIGPDNLYYQQSDVTFHQLNNDRVHNNWT